jgi:hypothetical protein
MAANAEPPDTKALQCITQAENARSNIARLESELEKIKNIEVQQPRTPRNPHSSTRLPDPTCFTDPVPGKQGRRSVFANIFGNLLSPPAAQQLHLVTPPVSPPPPPASMNSIPDEIRFSRHYGHPGGNVHPGRANPAAYLLGKPLLPDAEALSKPLLPDPLDGSVSSVQVGFHQQKNSNSVHVSPSHNSTAPAKSKTEANNAACKSPACAEQNGRFEERVANLADRLEKVLTRRSQVCYVCVMHMCMCVYSY